MLKFHFSAYLLGLHPASFLPHCISILRLLSILSLFFNFQKLLKSLLVDLRVCFLAYWKATQVNLIPQVSFWTPELICGPHTGLQLVYQVVWFKDLVKVLISLSKLIQLISLILLVHFSIFVHIYTYSSFCFICEAYCKLI